MAKSLDAMLTARPVDRSAVDAHKGRLLEEIRADRLKELRKNAALTQGEVADRLGVGQNRISNIERGDLAHIQIDTLRRYVESVGGSLRVEVELGDDRFHIA